ncbi:MULTISPECIES: hypothetical protein [unclassified Streptomyces]|uniref:hypothetical protein n=1 Tax=unclassified Streptomyces TaxID=2593676 RepID=UPI0001C1ABFB|nr:MULTISPECIES: hypothetical protein [unclassified Streptomyces]AEN10997.1 hypothetical protein SACTE_3130 [Streptomyces sp. SirexAA-E]MYR65970.1 hypothetical protein [Streptomyces sp. SID4939]MYR99021.1 hypothetical protein [Streptomyces sp. SID4940]MYT63734.1 hypothetical protein [Streptomyces sp. SID8357]MYT85984.1 hypothetical protein [Streptomyces sp. SID8360]
MSLPPHPGIFAAVERRCADSEPTPPLRLHDGSEQADVPLTLVRARQLLYDRSAHPEARASLWHQIAERVRSDTVGTDWPEAVVWLGLPGLRRTAYKITWRFRAERGDVEAELITCYLEALAGLTADDPDPGSAVLRSACSRVYGVWRHARLEEPAEDVERAGGAPVEAEAADCWQADYDPVPRRPGLSATVRITVPAHRVEGVRLGALARTWGAADTATSVGFSGRGRQVATVSLRRVRRSG